MFRRIMVFLLILAGLAMTRGLQATDAKGQASSFRALSSFAVLVGENVYVLDPSNLPAGWHQLPYGSLTLPPVPASSLISLESGVAITETGEGWMQVGASGWQSAGTVPGVVGSQRTTWGAAKAKFH